MKQQDFIVEIVFKDCDSVLLTSDYLNHLYLGDVSTNYTVLNLKDLEEGLALSTSLIANDVKIYINSKMKDSKLKTCLGIDAYERLLESDDITQIYIDYSGNRQQFFVCWSEEDEDSNRFQTNSVEGDKDEELIISIKK